MYILEAEFSVANPDREASAIAWSPDGERLAVLASLTRAASVFAVPGGEPLGRLPGLAGGMDAIAWASADTLVVPTAHAGTSAVSLWKPSSGEASPVPGPEPAANTLFNKLYGFTHDPRRLVLAGWHYGSEGSGRRSRLAVYDMRDWSLRAQLPVAARRIALSPTATRLAVAPAAGGWATYALPQGEPLQFMADTSLRFLHIRWVPGGDRLVTASPAPSSADQPAPSQLQLWDASSAVLLAAAGLQNPANILSLDVSPDGRWLLTATSDSRCGLWRLDGDLVPGEELSADTGPTAVIARFSPDGSRIAVVSKGTAVARIYRRQ